MHRFPPLDLLEFVLKHPSPFRSEYTVYWLYFWSYDVIQHLLTIIIHIIALLHAMEIYHGTINMDIGFFI